MSCERYPGSEWRPRSERVTDKKIPGSVFANAAVDSIRPCVNPALQVADLLESIFLQQFYGFYPAWPHLADRDDFLVGIQLVQAPG